MRKLKSYEKFNESLSLQDRDLDATQNILQDSFGGVWYRKDKEDSKYYYTISRQLEIEDSIEIFNDGTVICGYLEIGNLPKTKRRKTKVTDLNAAIEFFKNYSEHQHIKKSLKDKDHDDVYGENKD